jgi:hypothetical protein
MYPCMCMQYWHKLIRNHILITLTNKNNMISWIKKTVDEAKQ